MDITYLIPFLYLIYGVFFLVRTPAFLARSGIATKQSRRSETIWKHYHRIVGVYCIAAAAITAGLAYLEVRGGSGEGLRPLFWVRTAVEIGTIAAVIPLANALTARKFPPGVEDREKKPAAAPAEPEDAAETTEEK